MSSPTKRFYRLALLAIACALPLVYAQDATPSSDASPDTVVARYGDQVETLGSLQGRFEIAIRSLAASQGLTMSDELRAQLLPFLPQYLEQRASELVLLGAAKQRGLEVNEDDVDSIVQNIEGNVPEGSTVEELLASAGFRDEEQLRTLVQESNLIGQLVDSITAGIQLSDAEVVLGYQGNKQAFTVPEQVCASHILVDTEEEATTVLQDLLDGADFAEEAAAKSTDPGGASGGDLGCFGREQMVKPFADAAFDAPIGTPIGPVQSQFGYHIILVQEHDTASVRPLAEVREQVERQLRQAHADQIVQALVRSSGVHTYPDRLPAPPVADESGPEAAPAEGAPTEGAPTETVPTNP